MNKKAAIELSANFIVILVISIVILAGGLMLFFKLKDSATSYVEKLDSQTQEKLKNVMLSNNYRVAAYPTDLTIDDNDAKLIGIGITNVGDLISFNIVLQNVTYYKNSNIAGDQKIPPALDSDYVTGIGSLSINPKEQVTKGILLKMPKNSESGQYIYTFKIINDNADYGVVQVYVTNP